MRITRFDLLRYGKFTDKSVSLPCATKDFHLIIGPNEAGKSTLRSAIQDLFFGIETRSRYNFLHPHSEMRLGALIEQGERQLDFIRSKARTKTLQTASGTPLPDNALTPFLGPVDRVFFDQMFGLNHERLVTGGQEILSASNDIGQILFQAAAGIGSLGAVRDRLEAEASQLWAKRKANDREYYMASAELELAEAALKQTTVRTKDWQTARTQVDLLTQQIEQARERYQVLEQARIQLERVRRVAPMLTTLDALDRQLADLGAVISLPATAAQQLAHAEREVALATQANVLFEQQSAELRGEIAALHPDESILARGPEIEALSAMRQQLRTVAGDIAKREGEVLVLWQDVQQSVRQLGWPDDAEEAITQRLPGSLLRATLDSLIRRHDVVLQALASAEEALNQRKDEVDALSAQIEVLPESELSISLLDGLAAARSLGDVSAHEKQLAIHMGRLARELDAAVLELGAWRHEPDRLRQLLVPTLDETNALIKHRSDLVLSAAAIKERLAQANADIQSLELEISQYKAAHHPVTLADVQQARGVRDSTWLALKSGACTLKEAAPNYEKEVAASDLLSDQRHDRAQAETELQAKLDRLQRLHRQWSDLESRAQDNAQTLGTLDQDWQELIKGIGLGGMPLLKVNDWRVARARVLSAAAALTEAQASQHDFSQSLALVRAALSQAMLNLQPQVETLTLSGLILLADDIVTMATRAKERRATLAAQKIRAEASIAELNKRFDQAQAGVNAWQLDWQKNLALAHLPVDARSDAIEGALMLFERMYQQLQKIREVRLNRIDVMRQDLADFDDCAKALALALVPDSASESASQIALKLEARLKQESAASDALGRLRPELEKVLAQANAASKRILEAVASLAPLLRLSATADNDELRIAIERSDFLRLLTAQLDQTLKQLLSVGDGLPRDVLKAEFDAVDISTISARLSDLKHQIDDVVGQQNRLCGELNAAETELGKIAGQGEAARAESQRQEALARMANAVARYIKVYTAAKLLRWSIERFRESKQGPMLARASHVFEGLTQGAFNRLIVNYESEPLKLSGQRSSAELVAIDGMSEGTRDQLYLALRLAALELHLAQTVPLPFIADDLFINYDDGRASAGLAALAELSEKTQVIFLSHHAHLVPVAQSVFGDQLNVVYLG